MYLHEAREKKVRYVGPRPGFPEPCADYWNRMEIYLTERHLSFLAARGNGWYPAYYKSAPRIVIPCSNTAGVPYFQARDMGGKAQLRYASPPAPRDDSIVLVWPHVMKASGTVIVEGPMDALAAAGLGFLGIAVMGNQPTYEVIEHLAGFARSFQPVIVLPDADALEFGANVLCPLAMRGISGMIRAPHKKDLAEMRPEERKEFLI